MVMLFVIIEYWCGSTVYAECSCSGIQGSRKQFAKVKDEDGTAK